MAALGFDLASVPLDAGRLSSPTQYKGMTLRSRLEARWAIFFDYCDIRWAYEPVLFASGSRRRRGGIGYIPDFRLHLPDRVCFAECKPSLDGVSALEWSKIDMAGFDVLMLDGTPAWREYQTNGGQQVHIGAFVPDGQRWLVEEAIVYSNEFRFT